MYGHFLYTQIIATNQLWFYTLVMLDLNYHSRIPIEALSLLHCDVRDFNFHHPIKNIFYEHIDYIRELDASGKARPCVLDNIERSILCRTFFLGFDEFECPDCGNFTEIPHACHSRFCNACGVKYAKQLAAKATSFCLDYPHRHIVFTIPEELRNWFRQDRKRLNILFIAARNTISILTNKSLSDKLKKKRLSDTHYIFKDQPLRNDFGMIATIHTFGRDLKWNPHVHCLIPELIYSRKDDKIKRFHHFNFNKLRKTFQYEIIHLMLEAGALKNPGEKNRLYNDHPKGFYVYAKFKSDEKDTEKSTSDYSKDIQGCVNYFIRYAGRPAMAESRIINYDKESKTVSWFYNDHKDGKRYEVTDNAIDFINKLIIHILDYHFLMTRYYGFYSNASQKTLDRVHELLGIRKKKDYSRKTRTKKLKAKLNKLKYRTHLIDSFNRDPIQCKCGTIMRHTYSYNPLEGIRNDRTYRKRCIDEMYRMRV